MASRDAADASPGPIKMNRAGELKDIWEFAEERISEAEAIVFVGYRFPPTDANARKRLLAAIGRNKATYLPVHTVLGPESPRHTARLSQLLKWTISDGRTEQEERSINAGVVTVEEADSDKMELEKHRFKMGFGSFRDVLGEK